MKPRSSKSKVYTIRIPNALHDYLVLLGRKRVKEILYAFKEGAFIENQPLNAFI